VFCCSEERKQEKAVKTAEEVIEQDVFPEDIVLATPASAVFEFG
jgi:hypothetical protein